jgi:hypothetical protein
VDSFGDDGLDLDDNEEEQSSEEEVEEMAT